MEITVLWSVLVACPKHGSLSSLTGTPPEGGPLVLVAHPTNGSLSIGGMPHKWEPVLIDGNPPGGGAVLAGGIPHEWEPVHWWHTPQVGACPDRRSISARKVGEAERAPPCHAEHLAMRRRTRELLAANV